MKKITISLIFFFTTLPMFGSVSTRVCLSDGNTPLELADPNIPFVYRDVMVGTKLTIIVYSDSAIEWYGGALVLEEPEMANRGMLYGRDFDGFEYPGSCLPAAGDAAAVLETFSYPGPGFELYGGNEPSAGDWFIFDYNALDIGDCNISFYDLEINESVPIHTLSLYHVRTRDFDGNAQVDFADFAVLASYWLEENCGSINNCEGTDLDINGNVDFDDLSLFVEYWLEKTE